MPRPFFVLLTLSSVVGSTGFLAQCKTSRESVTAASSTSSKVDLDYKPAKKLKLNEEYIPEGEADAFASYAESFRHVHGEQQAQNEKTAGAKNRLRGMHAKGHGCVKGTFQNMVTNKDLARGLFSITQPMEVTARFSNGSGHVQADGERDLRGMALKVKIGTAPQVEGAIEPGVHDLLMTNGPYHHARDIVELMGFIESQARGGFKSKQFLLTHPRLATTLLKQTGRNVSSMLNETYWSRAPYRIGEDKAMKFLAKPCETVTPRQVNDTDKDRRLTYDMVYQFESRPSTCFDIYVQLQNDPDFEPIEDHAVEWLTAEQRVARVSFPKQTPDRGAACENMVFYPWNAHAENRPLGNFNRARRYIYAAAEAFRREKLAVTTGQ